MAPKKSNLKKATKSPLDQEQAAQEANTNKGYAGTDDHLTGRVPSDPSQATDEQIRQARKLNDV